MRFCHETSRCPNPRSESEWLWEHNYLWMWKCYQGSQYEQHDTPPIFFGRLWIFIFLMRFYFSFVVFWCDFNSVAIGAFAVTIFCRTRSFSLLDLLSRQNSSFTVSWRKFKIIKIRIKKLSVHQSHLFQKKTNHAICVSNWRSFPIVFWLAYNLLLRISLALAKESGISTFCLGRPYLVFLRWVVRWGVCRLAAALLFSSFSHDFETFQIVICTCSTG